MMPVKIWDQSVTTLMMNEKKMKRRKYDKSMTCGTDKIRRPCNLKTALQEDL